MDPDNTPPFTVPWDQVLQQPWLIQAFAVLALLVVVGMFAPKSLGRYSEAVETWTNGRRRTRTASATADVTALRAQVDNLETMLGNTNSELRAFRDETRAYQRRHDDTLGVHAQWDRSMIQLVVQLGGQPLPLPPLYPETPHPAAAAVDGDYSDIDHP